MKGFLFTLGVIGFSIFAFICKGELTRHHSEKEYVDAVYWHEGSRYSVGIERNNVIKLIGFPNTIKPILIADVPEG